MTPRHPRPTLLIAALGLSLAAPAQAAAPTIQTEGPVIHLADNLDEEAQLGWCIDTLGRGFNEVLHSHSCKPSGEDVLFTYDAERGMIQSPTYDGKCMALSAPDSAETPFGLLDCDAEDAAQRFSYDPETMELHPGDDAAQCVTVAPQIDDAGPFQSRALRLAACDALEPGFKQWVIKE